MDWVLNTNTDTLHRPREDRGQRVTQCSALTHVSPEHVETGAGQSGPETDEVDRCGRCYRDASGY